MARPERTRWVETLRTRRVGNAPRSGCAWPDAALTLLGRRESYMRPPAHGPVQPLGPWQVDGGADDWKREAEWLRKPHLARCEGRGGSPDRIRGLAADALINRIAAAQHGLLSMAQMEEAGISARIVQHRVQEGTDGPDASRCISHRAHRESRGRRRWRLFSCAGPVPSLSHWTAGALHGLLVPRRDHPIQVTVVSGGPRSRPGSGSTAAPISPRTRSRWWTACA